VEELHVWQLFSMPWRADARSVLSCSQENEQLPLVMEQNIRALFAMNGLIGCASRLPTKRHRAVPLSRSLRLMPGGMSTPRHVRHAQQALPAMHCPSARLTVFPHAAFP